jgi:hypothetical protein
MDKKYRLTKIKLDEVSLVGRGDDPKANVILSKSDSDPDESDSIPANQLGGNGMGRKETPAIIDKSALPDDVREYIDALEEVILAKDDNDEPDDTEDGIENEDYTYEDDDYPTDEGDSEDKPEEPEDRGVGKNRPASGKTREGREVSKDRVLSKSDPEVRELIAKMDERIAKAEAIAKFERDEREKREWIAKAQTLPHINDKPEELGGLLKSLSDKAPVEAAAVEKLLRAANNQVAKSGMWDEIGRSGDSHSGSSLDMKAAELRKTEPNLTREQAEARALEMDPSLYDEYLTERGMR